MTRCRLRFSAYFLTASLCVFLLCQLAVGFSDNELSADRYMQHVEFLASDALKGRGNGSPELERAAEYLASEFGSYGLRPGGNHGSYFQTFKIALTTEFGSSNEFRVGDLVQRQARDFVLVPVSSAGAYDGSVVFAGYGITAPEYGWDDYTGIDVAGRAVVVFLHSPEENDVSVERLGAPGFRSAVVTKIRNARQHGARAILLVTDPNNHRNENDVIGRGTDHLEPQDLDILAMHVTRESVAPLFESMGKSMSSAQKAIDDSLLPHSFELSNSTVHIRSDVRRTEAPLRNVVAMIPGSDAQLKQEWIVIGAHYDHLGLGVPSSLDPSNIGKIHPGADDNASGAAGVLELARFFERSRPTTRRSILFVAFAGEELGMIGSHHFVDHPPVPLSAITTMINLDMIGRLSNFPLNILSSNISGAIAARIRDSNSRVGLTLAFSDGASDSSDHVPFQSRNIPAMAFFSGLHDDYHAPSDTSDRIDAKSAIKILAIVADTVQGIANAPPEIRPMNARNPLRPGSGPDYVEGYFGAAAAFGAVRKEVFLQEVQNGSPAAAAGLKAGDILLEFSGADIKNIGDFTTALESLHAGDMAAVVVNRNGKRIQAVVTLSSGIPAPATPIN